MGTISRWCIVAGAVLLFCTCKKEKESCKDPEQKDVPVKAEWNLWFDSIKDYKTIALVSDAGHTETFYTSNLIYKQLSHHVPDSCIDYIFEESYLEYISLSNTFYFLFDFAYNGKNYPVVQGEFYQKAAQPYANRDIMYYNIDTPLNSYIKALNPEPPGNDSICSCCVLVKEFTTKHGDTYEDVLKIESASSHFYKDNEIKRIYLSRHYGVVEFVTNKNETWTFDLK